MAATGRGATDPARCEEYGYRLGDPAGIFVLRYRSAGPLEFGAVERQDFLHQLYWSPDGVLSVIHGADVRFIGPREAFWAERAVSHEVRAADRQTVYRIFLRQTPTALREMGAGPAWITARAGRLIEDIARSGVAETDALAARAQIMADLSPGADPHTPDAPARTAGASGSSGTGGSGYARTVAHALTHHPGDPHGLPEWADRLHISVKTLQRDFQREFGMPYTRWRTKLRLSASRALLGTEPVTRIARRVGYASPSAFVAAFAQEYGATPARYLRQGGHSAARGGHSAARSGRPAEPDL